MGDIRQIIIVDPPKIIQHPQENSPNVSESCPHDSERRPKKGGKGMRNVWICMTNPLDF